MDKLQKYREKIDVIDSSLLKLLAKRMRVVERVGKYKKRNDIEVVQDSRYEQIVKRLLKINHDKVLDENLIREMWEIIHRYSVQKQESI